MGGMNSGRRRSTNRGAVEHFPAIDLRVLKRAGLLREGECTYTTLHWGNNAPETLSARIFIDLSDTGHASMRIAGSEHEVTTTQRAAVECVPCPFGGVRAYFLCPITGVRCQQLFRVDGIFASRKAHKLTYASQSEDHYSRARRRVRKLQKQLEGDARYARPRGPNRWHTVKRLARAKRKARSFYFELLSAKLDRSD